MILFCLKVIFVATQTAGLLSILREGKGIPSVIILCLGMCVHISFAYACHMLLVYNLFL